MAYVERSGKVWRARWLLGDGRRRGSRSGFATKWEAKHFADAREVAERAAAQAGPEQVVTVGAWWARWFPEQDLAPATLEAYAQQYRRYIAPRFAAVPIGQVTGLDLVGFARELRSGRLAASSVTVVLSVLRDLLADAAAEGVIPLAPAMPSAGRRRHAGSKARAGLAIDLETVLRVCERLPPQGALMVITAVFTGMRWGEVCGMRACFLHVPDPAATTAGTSATTARAWYEIDTRIGAVHEDVHARRYFGPPKGGSGRIVDLPPFLATLLARHIEACGGRELLFVNRREEPIRHTDWLRVWHAACDGDMDGPGRRPRRPALCSGARFHDLRHTHATMLVESGVPQVLRDERLGHRPPGVRGTYTHVTPSMRAAMVAGLELVWRESISRVGTAQWRVGEGCCLEAVVGERRRSLRSPGPGSPAARCGRSVPKR
jgi:integrase